MIEKGKPIQEDEKKLQEAVYRVDFLLSLDYNDALKDKDIRKKSWEGAADASPIIYREKILELSTLQNQIKEAGEESQVNWPSMFASVEKLSNVSSQPARYILTNILYVRLLKHDKGEKPNASKEFELMVKEMRCTGNWETKAKSINSSDVIGLVLQDKLKLKPPTQPK